MDRMGETIGTLRHIEIEVTDPDHPHAWIADQITRVDPPNAERKTQLVLKVTIPVFCKPSQDRDIAAETLRHIQLGVNMRATAALRVAQLEIGNSKSAPTATRTERSSSTGSRSPFPTIRMRPRSDCLPVPPSIPRNRHWHDNLYGDVPTFDDEEGVHEHDPHVHNCPRCSEGGLVCAYDGDHCGHVTEYLCLTCSTRFKPKDARPCTDTV